MSWLTLNRGYTDTLEPEMARSRGWVISVFLGSYSIHSYAQRNAIKEGQGSNLKIRLRKFDEVEHRREYSATEEKGQYWGKGF